MIPAMFRPMGQEIGIISKYKRGGDFVIEWMIDDFFILEEMDGGFYTSPDFSFGRGLWYLKIFPNGWSRTLVDSSGHVNLHLYRSGRSSKSQLFSLSLKTGKGEMHNEQHYTVDFVVGWDHHESIRFIQRSELDMKSSELVPDGFLTVICTMKKKVSHRSDSSSKWYWPFFKWNSKETATVTKVAPAGNAASVECCLARSESYPASASSECCYCKGTFHQKKFTQRPIKCDCLEVIRLQKWLDEHECQKMRPEAGNDPERAAVDPFIQSIKASILTVEASTQTVEEKCEASTSGSSTNSEEKKVLHDLKELFLNKEDSDIIIKVEGSEFPAHRTILKARSPVFASTFRNEMKENFTGILEIQDCDSSAFSDFLCFLYCGDVGIISQENVFGLFTAADKYEVLDLRAKCLEFIKKEPDHRYIL